MILKNIHPEIYLSKVLSTPTTAIMLKISDTTVVGHLFVISTPSLLKTFSSCVKVVFVALTTTNVTMGNVSRNKADSLNKIDNPNPIVSPRPNIRFQKLSLLLLLLRNKMICAIDRAKVFTNKVVHLTNLLNTKSIKNIPYYYFINTHIVSQRSLASKEISFLFANVLSKIQK